MIPRLLNRETPVWLAQLTDLKILSIESLLENSLYYPSSGRDGDPVRYLGGFIHSFIYVDYGVAREDVLQSLGDNHHGFKGYRVIHCRDVEPSELTPHGWKSLHPGREDGDPLKYRDYMKKPFALWAIFERNSDHEDGHGPIRFSLLYICGDGEATFQALYLGNKRSPEVVAIIQPGTGFGLNWTNFSDASLVFGRSVLDNPSGKPQYLLYGGWGADYKPSCWPEYSELVHYWKIVSVDGELGLWKRYV